MPDYPLGICPGHACRKIRSNFDIESDTTKFDIVNNN